MPLIHITNYILFKYFKLSSKKSWLIVNLYGRMSNKQTLQYHVIWVSNRLYWGNIIQGFDK